MSHTPQAHPLAAQTTEAMWALLRGLQHTDEASSGALLRAVSLADLHAGLLTTVLRLIVLLYAEGRDLMTARDAPAPSPACSSASNQTLPRTRTPWPRAMVHGLT